MVQAAHLWERYLGQPFLQVVEGVLCCDVEREQNAVGASVVAACHRPVVQSVASRTHNNAVSKATQQLL